jgi:hypothetical protein
MVSHLTFVQSHIATVCGVILAYVDPGSGTLILQLLGAALIGALFYVRKIIGWFHDALRGRFRASVGRKRPSESTVEPNEVSRPIQG